MSSAPSAPACAAAQCVFVDDLPFNLTPAQELGMATVHHTERRSQRSRELERVLGLPLRDTQAAA